MLQQAVGIPHYGQQLLHQRQVPQAQLLAGQQCQLHSHQTLQEALGIGCMVQDAHGQVPQES
jgi:hypothetical protein